MSNIFIGEILGTALLVLLGNGVVSNVVYKNSKGNNSGWIVITTGWAIAVFAGVLVANVWKTGAHINPAVTVALLVKQEISFKIAAVYISAQFIGAILGQLALNCMYAEHIKENEAGAVLACHSTGSTHPKAKMTNLFTEALGTFVLVGMVLLSGRYFATLNAGVGPFIGPITVAIVVFGIGLSLGGVTGYAINPARDLGPRILFHFTQGKRGSADWGYSWIPVLGPILGGIIAALLF